ncbi:MAG: hypothetical protein MJE12_25525 [Alphaproteobacteria bacterium]|nr:hypothetical protein [Alphaproteobacteria bacterium]
MKKLLFAVMAVAVSVGVTLVLAEIALRFFPVSTGLFSQPVNDARPVFSFLPNRDYLWSRDWNFSIVNGGRVNNAGFVNDRDYDTGESTPLLAVIGDSVVEATMVPYANTLQGRLATEVAGRARVYSFAASGAPLSQYLAWARHARDVYRPDAMAFVVIGNDFDESLLAYRQWPGFHHYHEDKDGVLRLVRVDYEPNPRRALVQRSALARYLLFNLQVMETAARTTSALQGYWSDLTSEMEGSGPKAAAPSIAVDEKGAVTGRQYLGNVPRVVGPKRVSDSKRAVDAFFRDLPEMSGLAPARICFVVDGVRYPGEKDPQSYFIQMRRYLLSRAEAQGYCVIDMDDHFLPEHRKNGTRFEFPTDGHWNGIAHGLAARAVADTTLFKQRFAPSASGKP